MKLIIAAISSCFALGATNVGGEVVNCTSPYSPPSKPPVVQVTHHKVGCGCGETVIVKNNIHINIHNNIHNHIHNKGK